MAQGRTSNALNGLAYARQLFLFGNGNGQPWLDTAKLAEAAGVHVQSIRNHLPAWTAERESLLKKSREIELGFPLRVDEQVLRDHESDVRFLREQVHKLANEIRDCDKAANRLLELCESLKNSYEFSPADADSIISLVRAHLDTSANRRKLLATYLTVLTAWQNSGGVAATLSAFECQLKEQAKGQARLAAKEQERAAGFTDPGRPVDPVFRRQQKARADGSDRA